MIFSRSSMLQFILAFVLTVTLISCEYQEERTKLNSRERKFLDSVYNKRMKTARKQADSICDKLRDSLYDEYIDSIRELRLIEVDQIIND